MEPEEKPTSKTAVSEKPQVIIEGNKELFQEGLAKIYTKYISRNDQDQLVQSQVFYNPIQVFNRDLSILVMQQYINNLKSQKENQNKVFEGVNIVDALSASGLRTIRFIKELTGVKRVFANDISEASHKLMKDNFDLNNLDKDKYKMTLEDANQILFKSRPAGQLGQTFDIIDLDPYGSVVPFLESAVSSIRDGGLLCATCTDTRVTCGPDLHKCMYFYGTTRAKVQCFQENALRIVLNTINTTANRHSRYIQPLLSVQTEFYLRVFVRIHRSKTQCAKTGVRVGNVFNCNSCGNYEYQTLFNDNSKGKMVPSKLHISGVKCNICSQPYFFNGPIWLNNINNLAFCQQLIGLIKAKQLEFKSSKKIYGMLHALLAEKQLSQIPLGFNAELASKSVKVSTPNKRIMMAAFQELGYKVASGYIHEGQYKTNAPFGVLYDILVAWKIKQVGEQKLMHNVKEQYSLNILKRKPEKVPSFEYELKEKPKHVPQFFPHEQKGMGPKGKPAQRIIEDRQEPDKLQEVPPKKKLKP